MTFIYINQVIWVYCSLSKSTQKNDLLIALKCVNLFLIITPLY